MHSLYVNIMLCYMRNLSIADFGTQEGLHVPLQMLRQDRISQEGLKEALLTRLSSVLLMGQRAFRNSY